MAVFLNRDDVIVSDRELIDDSVRHFENRSMLLGPRERVLAALKAKGVGFVAAWSPEVRANIKPWGLQRRSARSTRTPFTACPEVSAVRN